LDSKITSTLAIAICSADPVLRRSLEQLLRQERDVGIVGVVDEGAGLLALIEKAEVDAVLIDASSAEQFAELDQIRALNPPFLVLVDPAAEETDPDLLNGYVRALLPRAADSDELLAAIRAVAKGYVVLPQRLLAALLDEESTSAEFFNRSGAAPPALTPRELEVLAAMADGASNKAIARRLGISFHTAKFHVAAILAKLDADSRTEAVTKAAQSGLVML
jgi:DNA-binding NarL/FixJ family response regulator